jgi:hypothetical protein
MGSSVSKGESEMTNFLKSTTIILSILAVIFGIGVLTNSSGCRGVLVNNANTIKAVGDQGYSQVRVISSHIFFVSWRGCGRSDSAAYSMRAKNSLGREVNLIACAGWPFKGVTVRTE